MWEKLQFLASRFHFYNAKIQHKINIFFIKEELGALLNVIFYQNWKFTHVLLTLSHSEPLWIHLFCWRLKKMFWRILNPVTIRIQSRKKQYYVSQRLQVCSFLQNIFFLFNRRRKKNSDSVLNKWRMVIIIPLKYYKCYSATK